jgi:hypothetical protein
MSSFPLYVLWLWAGSALAQLIVLALLFAKGNARKLPFFTLYVGLDICQVGFLLLVYAHWGTNSPTSATLAWSSECITLVAQALATIEILSITLKPYPGIWGLGWRALAAAAASVVIVVALISRGHGALELWFEINRGYHLTFATALISCLLLVRYYSIQVPAAYKLILGGFCLNSCVEVLSNTLIQVLAHKGFALPKGTWQFVTTISFVVALVIWAVALRKPLPAENRQIASLSDSSYQQLSPEINQRLRELNEKLLRLWKLEARPN